MSTLDHLLVASGKVREIYDLGDETLLLVASDRISAFDVILPTPIPDKGRVLTGMTRFWLERTGHIVANHMLGTAPSELPELARSPELAGRSMLVRKLEMLPGRVRRARLPGRLRLEGLPAQRHGLRAPAARRASRRRSSCPSRCSRRPRRPSSAPTTRTSPPTQGIALVGEAALPGARAGLDRAVLVRRRPCGRARDHPGRHEVRVRRRRRRHAGAGGRGADARLVAVLAGRLVPHRAPARRASTSSTCATTSRRSTGTRRRPAPSCPTTCATAPRRATATRTSASPAPTSAPTSTRWE